MGKFPLIMMELQAAFPDSLRFAFQFVGSTLSILQHFGLEATLPPLGAALTKLLKTRNTTRLKCYACHKMRMEVF